MRLKNSVVLALAIYVLHFTFLSEERRVKSEEFNGSAKKFKTQRDGDTEII